jgi:serine/threonine-protein kinase
VVHRDVSPENILLSASGAVKLTDFGVALVRRDGDLGEDERVVGKPRYMAPEQLIGGPIDARTDVFSVGVVLFEALTGQSPFAGSSEAERQAAAYAGEIKQAMSLRPDVPFQLSAIVRQACASQSENRFASARQLLHALERSGSDTLRIAPPHELASAVERALAELCGPSESPRSGSQALAGELVRPSGSSSAFRLSLNHPLTIPPAELLETLIGH